jgi:glycosyltransferase involved in cell wall biosynthesis
MTVHLLSHGSEHTTARYFAMAINATPGLTCVYHDSLFDLSALTPEDLFFFVDPAPAWPLGLESLPCLTVAYLIDVHQGLQQRLNMAQFFDAVFIAQKDFLSAFEKNGHSHTYWLPLACDEDIHRVASRERCYDVGFVGSLGRKDTERHRVLSSVLPRYRTNDFLRYYAPNEMAEVYAQSKIVFNKSINGDVNMRVFEAMASGALLVTDRIANGLTDLFQEGTHYIGYDTLEEAIKQIDYFLENDDERKRIAASGQQAALAEHTYSHRWEQIIKESQAAYGKAPARGLSRASLGALYAQVFVALRQPWRISKVARQYGLNTRVARLWIWSWGRWVNARVPLTPNAIKARLYR